MDGIFKTVSDDSLGINWKLLSGISRSQIISERRQSLTNFTQAESHISRLKTISESEEDTKDIKTSDAQINVKNAVEEVKKDEKKFSNPPMLKSLKKTLMSKKLT